MTSGFSLADSFPETLGREWAHLWEIEDDRECRKLLEAYLDKGRGECHLRKAEIATLFEEEVRLIHREHYERLAWVIMPNHAHVLIKVGTVPMSEIVGNWKKHTGRGANKWLKRLGAFWAADYWDTFMRDAEHELKTRRYIENNPTKAGLVIDPRDWPWGSARFRDERGELRW